MAIPAADPSTRHTSRRAWHVLLPAGAAEFLLLAPLVWSPMGTTPWVPILLFAGAFAAYAAAAFYVKDAAGGGRLIWGIAIAMRLLVLPAEPSLSGEVHQYLQAGELQAAGVNPFGTETPHPPLAQIAFLAIALAGGAVVQAKLLWMGLDLATAWVLGRIAFQTGRSRRLTQLLWLWSPLLLVEVGWSGHATPLAAFTLSLVVLLARAPVASGICAGLSALAVPVAAAAIPAVAGRLGLRFLLGAGAGAVVLTVPYLTQGRAALASLVPWGGSEVGLGGPHLLVASVLPGESAPRWVALALLLAVAVWVAVQRLRPERALLWVLGAALLLGPVLRPADALLILPFAALRLSLPWILFTGLAFLAHVGPGGVLPADGVPRPAWVHLAVWVPVGVLLAREGLTLWRRRFPLAHVGAPGDFHRPSE